MGGPEGFLEEQAFELSLEELKESEGKDRQEWGWVREGTAKQMEQDHLSHPGPAPPGKDLLPLQLTSASSDQHAGCSAPGSHATGSRPGPHECPPGAGHQVSSRCFPIGMRWQSAVLPEGQEVWLKRGVQLIPSCPEGRTQDKNYILFIY